MQKKLVSVIVLCYNGEKYIKRCINSILKQSYDHVEIIFVNDGSLDNSEKIFKSLISKIEKRGYKHIYIYQENAGQAVATNKALKVFTGEYLTFLDVDDEYEESSIEKRVEFLKNNPNYGFVRTKGKVIDEDTKEIVGHIEHKNKEIKEDIFEDFVLEKDIWVANGCYMIRSEALLKALPSRQIFVSNGGQNWQILIPIAKYNLCGYIDEELFIYHVIKNSHSHNESSFEIEWNRILGYQNILKGVLESLDSYKEYEKILTIKYSKIKIRIARKYKKRKELLKEFMTLFKKKSLTIKDVGVFVFGLIGV